MRLHRRRRSPRHPWQWKPACSRCGPLGDWTFNEQEATERGFKHALRHVEPEQLELELELPSGRRRRRKRPTLPDPSAPALGGFHGPDSEAPETERAGAIEVYPRSGSQRRRVLDAIADAGDEGRTDDELRLELDLWRAEARREELKRMGWVEDSGRRRRTTHDGVAAVWRLTEQGRACYPMLDEAAA